MVWLKPVPCAFNLKRVASLAYYVTLFVVAAGVLSISTSERNKAASLQLRFGPLHGSWRWKSGLSMTCENLTPCTPYRTRYYINDRIGLRAQHAVLASRFGLEFLSSAKQQQQKHDIHHHDEAFKANLGLVSPQSQSIHHGSPSTSGDGGGQGIVCARNSGRLRTRRFLCVGSCPNP